MERQTFRAAHLVNNLLEFARPRQRTPLKTDLRGVLANAAESVETAFAGRRLDAWDVAYWAEKLQQERHSVSEEALLSLHLGHRFLSHRFSRTPTS